MTQLFGLIGFPLGHSFSRKFFTEKFAAEHIDALYENFPVEDVSSLRSLMESRPSLRGLNVTIPHKQAVMHLLDEVSGDAAAIGAVNVIKITRDENGKPFLTGFNSDWAAFRDTLRPLLGNIYQRKALVLGTGGASKAVVYALRDLGVEPTCVSRQAKPGCLSYGELTAEIMETHTVVVNTTPLGMYPDVDGCPPLPYEWIGDGHVCYDLVYNPLTTEFMRRCEARGASVKNGLDMLHAQAIGSWRIWNSR